MKSMIFIKPSFADWAGEAIGAVILGSVFVSVLTQGLFFLILGEGVKVLDSEYALFFYLTLVGFIIFLIVRQFRNFSLNRYWQLTDTEIVGGKDSHIRIEISSIKSARLGVPPMNTFERVWSSIFPGLKHNHSNRIFLKLGDNRVIILSIYGLIGWNEFLRQLLKQLGSRVQTTPFTDEDVELIKQIKTNCLINF